MFVSGAGCVVNDSVVVVVCWLWFFTSITCTNTGGTGYGTLELQGLVVYGELADVLESDFTSDIAALVKVKTFYESCTDIEAFESNGWTPLWNLYKEIGMY